MPFRTALSGLNASSAELRVIGNNVANAGTTGFKKSRVQFADIFASANLGASANAIGSGVRVADIAQQFSQGNIAFTDNNLDLAISGQGFFRLNDNGTTVYSRAGAFGVDRNGYLVNSQDQRLTGFLADSAGNITGALGDIQLDTSDIAPRATTTVDLGLNLDASADIPAAPVTTSAINLGAAGGSPVLDTGDSPVTTGAFDMVDTYGQKVAGAQLQFTYTGTGNDWDVTIVGAGGTMSTATFTVGTTSTVTLNWDPDGAGSQQTTPITIDVSTVGQATGGGNTDVTASANGAVQGVFDIADASTYNNSTSLTVYDSQGAAHLATFYYRKTGIPNQWETYFYFDGNRVDGAQANGSDLLEFSPDGKLSAINGVATPPSYFTTATFNPGGGAATMSLTMDYSSVNQFGGGFNVNSLRQDGYATGRLSGIDIDDTGVILARFTNGQSRTLAQIALANFSNPQGLTQLGDLNWAESYDSGAALVGAPGTSSLGLIESGALEGSNVDLTEQLVNMITAQRNFQANAQVISTADTITQSIINIR
ncbi:MAG TPA: flagellar hook protein FlgE [Gammaproteobacteria bacterium]|nr:flagellar hook protein FlgE [Gammaproteobacteria bacterium]